MGNKMSSSANAPVKLNEIVNPSVKELWYRKTITLQPYWDKEAGLQFVVDPTLRVDRFINPFKELHMALKRDDTYAIITCIQIRMCQNDFDEPVEIHVEQLFDRDEAMEELREQIARGQEIAEDEIYQSAQAPNQIERRNAFKFTIEPLRENHNLQPVYKPSLTKKLIKSLAGQENNFLRPSSELLLGQKESPIDEIFDLDHPFITFMQCHSETLRLVKDDVSLTHQGQYWCVKTHALHRVRTFIVMAGYSRLYRTTFALTRLCITKKPENCKRKSDLYKGKTYLKRVSFLCEVKYFKVYASTEEYDSSVTAQNALRTYTKQSTKEST